jgi:hypothetical protein
MTIDQSPPTDSLPLESPLEAQQAAPPSPLSVGRTGVHVQRTWVGLAAAAGMLATFLPWINAPFLGSVAGTAGDGWITLVMFLVVLLLVLVGDRTAPVTKPIAVATSVLGVGGAGIGIWKIASLASLATADPTNPFAAALASAVTPGIGLFTLIGAGAAVTALTWWLRARS